MTLQSQDGLGSSLVRALEEAWASIRRDHPELPAAVVITTRDRFPRATAGLVAALWKIAGPQLNSMLTAALDSVHD